MGRVNHEADGGLAEGKTCQEQGRGLRRPPLIFQEVVPCSQEGVVPRPLDYCPDGDCSHYQGDFEHYSEMIHDVITAA